MRFIVYNPVTELFNFFIESLIYELKNINIELIIIKDSNNISIYNNKKDILLIILNPLFIKDNIEIKKDFEIIKNYFKYKILYLSEPINFAIEKIFYNNLIKNLNPICLWTYTNSNFNKLNNNLKIYKLFPLYNEFYNFLNININYLIERNKNKIIFFGNITQNRIEICNQLNNLNLLTNITDYWTIQDWSKILNNYLFYLNIHRRENCKSLELFRITPILANGGVIFSEHCNEKVEEEYKNYNIIFTEKKNLINIFNEYIQKINYEEIFFKTIKYREDNSFHNQFLINFNSFVNYFNSL